MTKKNSMDERTMIREQERLAKEAKRKKTRKFKIVFGAVVLVAALGVIWYVGWGRNLTARTAATTVKIEKSMGQTVVYAKITEINGNEITYAVAEEVEEASTGAEEGADKAERMPDRATDADKAENMPDRTAGADKAENMPDRGQMGSMGGRGNAASTVISIDQFTYDGTTYRVGEETVTTYIPVGTNVTTKLGTVTTFSRLAADDYVALIMDKDGDEEVIAAVYIVG